MASHPRKYSLEPTEVPRVETPTRRIVTKLPVPESLPILRTLERFEPSSMQGQPPVLIHQRGGMERVRLRGGTSGWTGRPGFSSPTSATRTRPWSPRSARCWIVPFSAPTSSPMKRGRSWSELLAGLAPAPGYKVVPAHHGLRGNGELHQAGPDLGAAAPRPGRRVLVSFEQRVPWAGPWARSLPGEPRPEGVAGTAG